MTFAVGLAFQFPLVLLLLVRIGVLSVGTLRKSRRFVLVILMISAALITPGGDPVSLCILTIPLYFLFELSILIGALIEKKISSSADSGEKGSGITGSVFLLLSLVLLGGAGGWLYLNWEKAESFFLNLSPTAETGARPTKSQPQSKSLPAIDSESFLLELSPIDLEREDNSSVSPDARIYRARIRE